MVGMMSSGEDETPKAIQKWIIEAKGPDERGKLVKRTFVAYTVTSDDAFDLVYKYLHNNSNGRKVSISDIHRPRLADKEDPN